MAKYLPILLIIFILASCSKKEYFQKSALAGSIEREPNAPWDSATVIAGRQYDRNGWHTLWWGKHYRKVWAQPVTLAVLDLDRMHGGLSPEKKGGGFQTTSLTLENEDGKLYALRSVDKDPAGIVPEGLRKTFLTNVLRDQTSAAHPYAATVVSQLAIATKIPHSHPRYVYIPKGVRGLGKDTPEFRDRIFLLEEKFEGKESLTRNFGKAKDLVDSETFLKSRFKKHGHLPNQMAFAKARLFDVFIGDWDRHEGQWQWAVYENGKETRYNPVPKDRDQAFFRFDDGIMPWFFSRRWAPLKKMKTFKPKFTSIRGYLQNAHFIDERCLNEVTAEQWQTLALELKTQLTDSVIETAVATFPPQVYDLTGSEITNTLKARRNQLEEVALQMHQLQSKHVIIAGTDDKEKFMIERLPDGKTHVQMFQIPEDEKAKPLLAYNRIFLPSETSTITLHGLGSSDTFEVKGKTSKSTKLMIYGGEGEDEVKDESSVQGWSKKTRVYDTKQGLKVEKTKETKVKKSKHVKVHAFDREGL